MFRKVLLLMDTVLECSSTRPRPRNRNMPASVQMKGGMWMWPIQKPCQMPRTSEQTRQIRMTRTAFHPAASSWAPIAPIKQTVEPTERSMLPPVRIHSSMPQAMTRT